MFRWILFFIAVVCAYGPLVYEHGHHLWTRDYFQFFPVYILAIAFLVRERLTKAEFPKKRKWRVTPVSLGLSIPLLGVGLWIWSPWLAAVSFLLLGDSLLCHFPGVRRVWRLLALLIPLPLGLDAEIVRELQSLSSIYASRVLDFLNVPHVMQGNVLELDGQRLFVAEACSGIGSVYMLTAATLLYLVVTHSRLIRSVPLLLSVAWWALMANAVRIVTIAVAHQRYQVDLSSGLSHEAVGVLTMALALAGILSTKSLLDFLTQSIAASRSLDISRFTTLTPTILWDMLTTQNRALVYGSKRPRFAIVVSARRLTVTLTAILAAFCTTYWGMASVAAIRSGATDNTSTTEPRTNNTQLAQFQTLSDTSFASLPDFHVDGFDHLTRDVSQEPNLFGEHSKEWKFESSAVSGTLSVCGPFHGWHDARVGYEAKGWRFETPRRHQIPGQRPDDDMVVMTMVNSAGQRNRLYCTAFYASGELAAPPQAVAGDVTTRVKGRLQEVSDTSDSAVMWQIQLVMQQSSGLSIDSQRQAERNLLGNVIAVLQRHWRGQ